MRSIIQKQIAQPEMQDADLESWPKYTGTVALDDPKRPRNGIASSLSKNRMSDPKLLVKNGVELHKKGEYERAVWSFQEAIKAQVLEHGGDHPVVAQTLANIGAGFLRQGRLQLAEEALTSALSIMEQIRVRCDDEEEKQQIGIADVLNNLGNLAYLEGSYVKSLQFYRQNLRELRRQGIIDGSLATSLHNIGRLHVIRREWDAASSILAQCQKVENDIYGSNSPQIADTLELIGYVYLSQKCYDNALIAFSDALSIHQRHSGAINESVATGLTNVAMVLEAQEKTQAAIQTYQAAIDVFLSIPDLDENHKTHRAACRGLENLKERTDSQHRDEISVSIQGEILHDERESSSSERREEGHLFERRDF